MREICQGISIACRSFRRHTSALEAAALKQWRLAEENMESPSAGRDILDWVGRLETWCAAQPAGSDYLGLHREFGWLRAAVSDELPGTYAPGSKVDDILRDLQALPHSRPEAKPPDAARHEFPQDIMTTVSWSRCAYPPS